MRALERLKSKDESTNPAVKLLSRWGAQVGPYSPFPPAAVVPALVLSLALFGLGLGSVNSEGKRDPFGFRWFGLVFGFVTLFAGGIYDFLTPMGLWRSSSSSLSSSSAPFLIIVAEVGSDTEAVPRTECSTVLIPAARVGEEVVSVEGALAAVEASISVVVGARQALGKRKELAH